MKVQDLPQYRPGEVLVRLKEAPPSGLVDVFTPQGATVLERFDLPPTRELSTQSAHGPIVHLALAQGQSVEQAISSLEQDPRVAYAVPNDLLVPLDTPNDMDARLWGLPAIQAPQAWEVTHGDRAHGPLVAVIDSGIDYHHPDLAANVFTNPGEIAGNGIDDDGNGVVDDVHGYNAAAKSGDPMDTGSHGTHVAGTIAAVGNGDVNKDGFYFDKLVVSEKG